MSKRSRSLAQRFQADDEVDSVVKRAVRMALAEHKRKNQSVAVWREGEVVMLEPKDIPSNEGDKP